jgi:hypothetical protein
MAATARGAFRSSSRASVISRSSRAAASISDGPSTAPADASNRFWNSPSRRDPSRALASASSVKSSWRR